MLESLDLFLDSGKRWVNNLGVFYVYALIQLVILEPYCITLDRDRNRIMDQA